MESPAAWPNVCGMRAAVNGRSVRVNLLEMDRRTEGSEEERLCRSSSAAGNTSHTSAPGIPTGVSLTSPPQTGSTPVIELDSAAAGRR